MKEIIQIQAEKRSKLGTGMSREFRSNKKVPGVIYGEKKDPIPITLDEKNLKIPGPNRAAAAAQSARAYFSTDIGIAALLPEENEDYAPGTVFIAISMQGVRKSRSITLPGALSRMRSYSVISLLDYLRKTLLENY